MTVVSRRQRVFVEDKNSQKSRSRKNSTNYCTRFPKITHWLSGGDSGVELPAEAAALHSFVDKVLINEVHSIGRCCFLAVLGKIFKITSKVAIATRFVRAQRQARGFKPARSPPAGFLSLSASFEQTLVEVWRQALVENAKFVVLGTERYPVRFTPKRRLREVDFVFDGNEIRGLQQNPETKSRWAQMARSGKKVMQFLSEGRYVANVVDGKVNLYGRRGKTSQ